MNRNDWSKSADELKGDLTTIERSAISVSEQLHSLSTLAESLKMNILKYKLETERQQMARAKGFVALRQDKRKLGVSLVTAVTGLVLGGAISKDGYAGLITGLNTFDASLQEFGRSRYAVSLDKQLSVVYEDQVYSGKLWVTRDSLYEALENLRKKALSGQSLGNLETIVSEVKLDRQTTRYLVISPNGQQV